MSQKDFVNPYNFVPLWGEVPRGEPESHEYFVGNRGRITCRITFLTPFFIPHPEKRFRVPKEKKASQVDDNDLPQWLREQGAKEAWRHLQEINASEGHEILALLRDEEGKPFIPGSSLKGAFRTVAEALSNSCLSQLEFEWELKDKLNDPDTRIRKVKRYYSYRKIESPQKVGKIIKLLTDNEQGKIQEMQKARIFFPRQGVGSPPAINLENYCDGQKVRVRFGKSPHVVSELLDPHQEEQGTCGVLKITETTAIKKSQRFIYSSNQDQIVYFSRTVELSYNRANQFGIEMDKNLPDDFIKCQIPQAGKRSKRHELRVGDIVYFNEQNGQVIDMGPVELYRILYKYSLDEILLRKHKDFLPCHDPRKLCPCCRIFGWLMPYGEEGARKGFVHFGTARWVGGDIKTKWVTLQPLGQPHPSCWQFYLHCKSKGENAGYNDEDAIIRGRKFYWHKPQVIIDKPQNGQANVNSVWDQRGGNGQPVADDQNKTVEVLLPDGAVFQFTVDFENLSDEELGLLLLTLQPNLLGKEVLNSQGFSTELYHHLGMGKPLGLGSAKIEILSLCLYDNSKRYSDLFETGSKIYTQGTDGFSQKVRQFVLAFIRQALKERGKQAHENDDKSACEEFLKMLHIRSLFIMLDWEKAKGLPTQYPPGHKDPNNKQYWEAFRWFTHRIQRDFLKSQKEMLFAPEEIAIEGKRQRSFDQLEQAFRQSRKSRGHRR